MNITELNALAKQKEPLTEQEIAEMNDRISAFDNKIDTPLDLTVKYNI